MSRPLEALITALKRFPGVGEKTATRYAFYILNADREEMQDLVTAIKKVREHLKLCSSCFGLTDVDPCVICSDPRRDSTRICVVENPLDLMAIEKVSQFSGMYHVLHGVLSPLDAIGPDDIRLSELVERAVSIPGSEVILALNPTVEGESTSSYIADRLTSKGIRVSRIAYGIPIGGSLEYADPLTLTRALENRSYL